MKYAEKKMSKTKNLTKSINSTIVWTFYCAFGSIRDFSNMYFRNKITKRKFFTRLFSSLEILKFKSFIFINKRWGSPFFPNKYSVLCYFYCVIFMFMSSSIFLVNQVFLKVTLHHLTEASMTQFFLKISIATW